VFALAWPGERAERMDLSLARVRRWLEADGCIGKGSDGAYRDNARRRALEYGLSGVEAAMVHGVLVAEERRMLAPGARVQERARGVVRAAEAARRLAEGRSGSEPRILESAGSTGRTGASVGVLEVERYAVEGHAWDAAGDAGSVVETLPWDIGDRLRLRVLPMPWWGIGLDPELFGLSGNDWRTCAWQFEHGKPEGFGNVGRQRVLMVLRPFGWSGAPIRADLDDVERYLPTRKGKRMAWLIPGVSGVGWAVAWRVER
jgi:hypothetical protein